MPKYHATGVRMRLAATNLEETVTHNLQNRNYEATKHSHEAEDRLRETENHLLNEENVPFPGDRDRRRVNFLKNVPFLQVQAGADLFQPSQGNERLGRRSSERLSSSRSKPDYQKAEGDEGKQTWRGLQGDYSYDLPTQADPFATPDTTPFGSSGFLRPPSRTSSRSIGPDRGPKALVLHIMLEEKSFLPDLDSGKPQDIMVDIFFNGVLSNASLLQMRDIKTEVKPLNQVFAGARVDILAEQPWVILPPELDTDGSLRGLGRAINAKERWEQICAALSTAADERGFNEYGDRPPSGDYLNSLATMEMPEAVERMQKPGGRRFGVVDAVITLGEGKKVTGRGSYLKAPARFNDSRFKENRNDAKQDMENPAMECTSSDVDAEGESDVELKQSLPLDRLPISAPASNPRAQLTPSSASDVPLEHISSTPLPYLQSAIGATAPEGLAVANPHITTTPHAPQTPERSFRTPAVRPMLPTSPPAGSSSSANAMPPAGLVAVPAVPSSSARRVSIGSTTVASFNPQSPSSSMAPARDPGTIDPDQPRTSALVSHVIITGDRGATVVDHTWAVPQRIPVQKPVRRPERYPLFVDDSLTPDQQAQPLAKRQRTTRRMPDKKTQGPSLSEDCVITYAPVDKRQIKAERMGRFTEEIILVGMRFFIAG